VRRIIRNILLVIGALFVIFFLVVLVRIWPYLGMIREWRRPSARSSRQERGLFYACESYAADHDGDFPPSLEALVPKYAPAAMLVSPEKPHEADGYIYTPGLRNDGGAADTNKVLIQDKFAPEMEHREVFVYADGNAGSREIRR
jgi:hypothetical protein